MAERKTWAMTIDIEAETLEQANEIVGDIIAAVDESNNSGEFEAHATVLGEPNDYLEEVDGGCSDLSVDEIDLMIASLRALSIPKTKTTIDKLTAAKAIMQALG